LPGAVPDANSAVEVPARGIDRAVVAAKRLSDLLEAWNLRRERCVLTLSSYISDLTYTLNMEDARKSPRCGLLVREARRRHKLDQAELARRLGTSQAAISRIERDLVSPSIETLNRVMEAMGETMAVSTTPLNEAAPGAGNVAISELRADYEQLTPSERLEQAAELSRVATELAMGAEI